MEVIKNILNFFNPFAWIRNIKEAGIRKVVGSVVRTTLAGVLGAVGALAATVGLDTSGLEQAFTQIEDPLITILTIVGYLAVQYFSLDEKAKSKKAEEGR